MTGNWNLPVYRNQGERLEPLIAIVLGVHGFIMLALSPAQAQPLQWGMVGFVEVLGFLGVWSWRGLKAAHVRVVCMLIAAWLLMVNTGGTGSFFLLWLFVLASVYPLVLGQKIGIAIPIIASFQYLGLIPFSTEEIPHVVVVTRGLLLLFIGGTIWTLDALARQYVTRLEVTIAELESLHAAAMDLSASLEPKAVLEQLARHFVQAFHATSSYIMQMDAGRSTVTVLAEYWAESATSQERKSDIGRIYFLQDYPVTARALERQEVLILQAGDMQLSEYERGQLLEYGIKSSLLVPLVSGGSVVGQAEIWDSGRIRSFSEEELRFASLLATHAAGAIENARLYAQTRQRETHLATVLNVARMVSSSLELEEVLQQVVFSLESSLNLEHCAISDYDPAARMITTIAVHAAIGSPSEGEEVGLRYALADFPSTAAVIEGGNHLAVHVDDPSADPAEVDLLRRYGRAVLLMVPMRIGERPVGLVELYTSDAHRRFATEEIQLARSLADQVAVAIENARLYTEMKKLSSAIAQTADSAFICDKNGVIEYVNLAFEEVTGYARSEAIGQTPRILKSGLHPSDFYADLWQTILGGRVFRGQVVNRKKNGDIYHELRTITPLKDSQDNITHFISTGKDITELKRNEAALQRQMKELSVLHEVALACTDSQSEDALIERVTQIIGESIYSDDFGVMLLDDPGKVLRFHPSYRRNIHEESKYLAIAVGKGITGRVAATGISWYVPDTLKEPAYADVGLLERMSSELCVPILFGNKVIGVINVESLKRDAFTRDDERLLYTVAGQIATAMERLRTETTNHRRMIELESLAGVSAALRAAHSLDDMLPLLMDQTLEVLDTNSGCIALFNPGGGRLQPIVERGWFALLTQIQQDSMDDFAEYVFGSGEVYRSREFSLDPRFKNIHELIPDGWGGVCVPIRTTHEIVGIMFVSVCLPREFMEDEIRLLTTLAEIAGNAIHRMRLYEQTLRQAEDLEVAYDRTLEGWAHALELRDQETSGHTQRVTEMTERLARALGVGEAEIKFVRWGTLLHDIGKMGIPDSILLKPGPLTREEWKVMKLHPQFAYDMLFPIAYLHPALDIPYCHHEKWDGTGYPRRLMGDQIPLAARIFTVVDVWDAVTSRRPYREPWSRKRAVMYLLRQSGRQFDPMVVKAFLELIE